MNQLPQDDFSLRAEIGAQAPMSFVNAAGTRIAVMRRGQGIPLVCLHSIGHGARDFETLAERVGDAFEIIAPDWPGQGRSPDDGVTPTPERYADIVVSILDALAIDRPILLGNSIGGATALFVAANHASRVRAIVLCNSGGLFAITAFVRFLIRRFVAFFRAGENRKRWFVRAFRFYYARVVLTGATARPQCERIIAAGYEIAGVLRRAWEGFARPEADLCTLVPRISVPVWLAWAKDDRISSWSAAEPAAKRFPVHEVTLFAGGHSPFLEDPDRFAQGLREFVRKHLRG